MSIILAVTKFDRTVIASDTISFCGSHRETPDNVVHSKLRTIGGSQVGSAGWVLYDNLFEHYLHGKKPPALNDERAIFGFFVKFWAALRRKYNFVNDQSGKDREGPFSDLDADFLIANRRGIFAVDSNLTVLRFKKYYAIGSGAPYAFGALESLYEMIDDPADIAARAVQVAVHFDDGCGGEPVVVPVHPRPRRRPPPRR